MLSCASELDVMSDADERERVDEPHAERGEDVAPSPLVSTVRARVPHDLIYPIAFGIHLVHSNSLPPCGCSQQLSEIRNLRVQSHPRGCSRGRGVQPGPVPVMSLTIAVTICVMSSTSIGGMASFLRRGRG